jgi:XisI protein
MDRLTQYRQYVQDILEQHARLDPQIVGMETYTVFDVAHDHYQVVTQVGRVVNGCMAV